MSSLKWPWKRHYFYIWFAGNNNKQINFRGLSNEKSNEIDSFEKFTVNGEHGYLFHEVLRAKALMWMIDESLSTAYRLLNKAKIALGRPLTYKLTLGEFCSYYCDQRPEWLAYRFWRYIGGGK